MKKNLYGFVIIVSSLSAFGIFGAEEGIKEVLESASGSHGMNENAQQLLEALVAINQQLETLKNQAAQQQTSTTQEPMIAGPCPAYSKDQEPARQQVGNQ